MFDFVVIAVTDVSKDSRVIRQIKTLLQLGSVACISPGSMEIENATHYRVSHEGDAGLWLRRGTKLKRKILLTGGFCELFYWSQPIVKNIERALLRLKGKVIVANDFESLPVSIRNKRDSRVFFDAHEYYPGQQSDDAADGTQWNEYYRKMCKQFMPLADAVSTVAQEIGQCYADLCGIECLITPNCPAYSPVKPSGIDEQSKIRLIHHGAYRRSRGINRLVEAVSLLPEHFELHLMLTGDRQSADFARLASHAQSSGRTFIHDSVAPESIVDTINQYDVGVYLLDPVSVNHEHALPNKFFEFIQARLAVAIGPSPSMASIVNSHELGLVTQDFTARALADGLNSMTRAAIRQFKQNSSLAAEKFCTDQAMESFRQTAGEMLQLSPKATRVA